uniref:transposase n=1 Tax=Adhaeribacter arboris TaxID=2072846 RepID=UPI001E4DF941|nr:transposase [Adhaeribacter arboris]
MVAVKEGYQLIFDVMQGKKVFAEEKVLLFSLSAHVPKHNFYRRLKQEVDLDFLYELTQPYFGRCGQQSIDPVVFFKLCLVGYLENIVSDHQLIEHCSLRLDLLYFLNYGVATFDWRERDRQI